MSGLSKLNGIFKAAVLILLSMTLTACSLNSSNALQNPVKVTGYKLNTYVDIRSYTNVDKSVLEGAMSLIDSYENMLSIHKEDALLYRVNHRQTDEIPAELAHLITNALYYSSKSDGHFCLTIGGVSTLWDFTAEHPTVPDETSIKEALSTVDDSFIELKPINRDEPEGLYKITLPAGTMLDLGAVAKGYIADKVKQYLKEHGVESAIINLGGNILCVGKKDRRDWTVGVRKPFGSESDYIAALNISDASVVSSGTYERGFTAADGTYYHHILNPKTGYSYESDLTQVTILSKDSFSGDCLSTTCFTLGIQAGLNLIESLPDTEAMFVKTDGSFVYSSGFENYLRK